MLGHWGTGWDIGRSVGFRMRRYAARESLPVTVCMAVRPLRDTSSSLPAYDHRDGHTSYKPFLSNVQPCSPWRSTIGLGCHALDEPRLRHGLE